YYSHTLNSLFSNQSSINYFILYYFLHLYYSLFFFNDTATTEIYTLSLHDALPIWPSCSTLMPSGRTAPISSISVRSSASVHSERSEEHTSELQSRGHLVCRLLLEKKKRTNPTAINKSK